MNKNLEYISIGQRIATLRNGVSQGDFALKFGISQADVSRLEKGLYKKPDIKLLFKICMEYRKSIDWLLTGEERAAPPACSTDEQRYIEQLLAILRRGGESAGYVKGILDLKFRECQECNESTSEYAAEDDAKYRPASKKGA